MSSPDPQQKDEYSKDLSIPQVFLKSFDLLRQIYLQLLPIFAGFGILVALVSTYFREVTPALNLPTNLSGLTQQQELAIAGAVTRWLEFRIANYFVDWLILYFAAGIGVWKIYQILGKKKKLAFELPKTNLASLAATFIITIVIVEVSVFLFFVGMLIFATMFYLSFPSAAAEGKYYSQALGRSRHLASGKWGKTFVVFAGTQILVYIGAQVVSIIVGLLTPGTLPAHFALFLALGLEFPLVSASMVVLHLSYRRGQEEMYVQKPPSLYDDLKPQPMGPLGGRFCTACGVQVSADEKFCHNCGAALSTQH